MRDRLALVEYLSAARFRSESREREWSDETSCLFCEHRCDVRAQINELPTHFDGFVSRYPSGDPEYDETTLEGSWSCRLMIGSGAHHAEPLPARA
jgi:anaerobic selenocysteine-containing dehydrogenase